MLFYEIIVTEEKNKLKDWDISNTQLFFLQNMEIYRQSSVKIALGNFTPSSMDGSLPFPC